MSDKVFSIGHSVLPIDRFLDLVKSAGITAIADVRTTPFSRYHPHFNQKSLTESLADVGVAYSFLGKELGGRPEGDDLYEGDTADYEAMAKTPDFIAGVERIKKGTTRHTVALMCSEKDPMDCHRCLLVSRRLAAEGLEPVHILSDGRRETQADIESRLMKGVSGELFEAPEETLARAYRHRSMKIAFKRAGAPKPSMEPR